MEAQNDRKQALAGYKDSVQNARPNAEDKDQKRLRQIADFALIPPKVITNAYPVYDYDTYSYLMCPGIARTPKGRIWTMIDIGCDCDNDDIFAVGATSDDNGETWSKPRLAIDGRSRALLPYHRTVVDFNLWTDPMGRLWLFFMQAMNHWDGRGSLWSIVCENPDDDNPVWSEPKYIGNGLMLNKPVVLSTGEWMLPAYLVQHFKGFKPFVDLFPGLDPYRGVNVYASVDSGKNWVLRSVRPFPHPDWLEPMIVEKKNGQLWMMARTLDGIMESFSDDKGYTWSEPVSTKSKISSTNARFFFRRLMSGNLLLVKYGKQLDSYDTSMYHGRNYLSAWLSEDDGKTWKGGLLVDDRPNISYPDGFQAPDGTIYLSYDHNRGPGEMLMARFTEKDILSGRIVNSGSKLKMIIVKTRKRSYTK
jgi:sialidase-1